MLLLIKLIIDLSCGVLFAWGGFSFIEARRFIMPSLLAIAIGFFVHSYLCVLYVLPVIGTLCLGYFGRQFLGRGLWLGLQAVVLGVGVVLSGHLFWFFYLPYFVIAFLLGGSLYDLEQIIGDFIFGCWLGIILFLLH